MIGDFDVIALRHDYDRVERRKRLRAFYLTRTKRVPNYAESLESSPREVVDPVEAMLNAGFDYDPDTDTLLVIDRA